MRKIEYFDENPFGYATQSIMSNVKNVYKQERDWTCSIACLRTILSGSITKNKIPPEDYYVNETKIIMGPQNSKNIVEAGILNNIDFKSGYIEKAPEKNQIQFITNLMTDYNVMIQCMINYSHWIVLLGYIHLGNIEEDIIIYYDPYYNKVNTIIADELINMWHDMGSNPLERDYIAVKK